MLQASGELVLKTSKNNVNRTQNYALGLVTYEPIFSHSVYINGWHGVGLEPDWHDDWVKADQSIQIYIRQFSVGIGAAYLYKPYYKENSSVYYGTLGFRLWD